MERGREKTRDVDQPTTQMPPGAYANQGSKGRTGVSQDNRMGGSPLLFREYFLIM